MKSQVDMREIDSWWKYDPTGSPAKKKGSRHSRDPLISLEPAGGIEPSSW